MAEPAPYPPTARPTAKPRASGNHFAITGIGVEYPKPFPRPPISPKQTYSQARLCVQAQRKNPRLTMTPPTMEIHKGPNLSCRRPATINDRAKVVTATVNVVEVWERVQWNSFSSGATNTLQPYKVPRAMFMDSPPMTRHQRLIGHSG